MEDCNFVVRTTERGFEVIDFDDESGLECSLQQSSAIGNYDDAFERPGSSFVWLGRKKNAPPVDGREMSPRMHLNREQVCELVERLNSWLSTGSFGD